MAGVVAVLLVLALVQSSSSELRCGNQLPISPTITDNGIILCRSILTSWSRNCYTCQEYSSNYFLDRFPGLFSKTLAMAADTEPFSSNYLSRARRAAPGIQTNNCCDTNWQIENHPLVTTNQYGLTVCPIALMWYTQKATYGRCVATNSNCMTHKTCSQHFVWISVLVWQESRSLPFGFDLIQIPASCICVG